MPRKQHIEKQMLSYKFPDFFLKCFNNFKVLWRWTELIKTTTLVFYQKDFSDKFQH